MGTVRQTVSKNIRQVCSLKRIRQVEIAEHLGVSQSTVSNWFKGTNSIDIENLAELCSFLGVSLDQVFGVEPINAKDTFSPEEKYLVRIYRLLNDDNKDLLRRIAWAFAGYPV